MSLVSAAGNLGRRRATRGAVHVPAGDGVTTRFDGAVSTVKLGAASTRGTLGLVEASIPPGAGRAAHAHVDADETFYLLSGELELLDGDARFRAGPGDVVHVPRGRRHGFRNVGLHPARVLILFTPGGPEGMFVEGGDEARPGRPVPPWGAERWSDPFLIALFGKYGAEALPEGRGAAIGDALVGAETPSAEVAADAVAEPSWESFPASDAPGWRDHEPHRRDR